jgi:hypothetical protein
MKEEWLMSGAVVPVDVETTAALVAEIKRLIDVVGGMALAQVEQEPVAWMTINEYGEEDDIHYENPEGHLLEGWTYKPLYTHPSTAQRPWQGLTDEEMSDIVAYIDVDFGDLLWKVVCLTKIIEATLKERNK